MNGHTHEFEPTFGFPESLPASEKVLWQGGPCAWLIARRIFFLPHLFFYFLILSCLALIFNSEVLSLQDLFVKFLSYMSLGMVAIFLLLAISAPTNHNAISFSELAEVELGAFECHRQLGVLQPHLAQQGCSQPPRTNTNSFRSALLELLGDLSRG